MYQSRESYRLESEKDHPIPILEKFLDFGNHSMLIKGDTGSGKLTLCFELANRMKEKYEIYFVTKGQTTEKIYRRAPWIQSLIPPTNVIDIYAKGESSFSEDFEVYEVLNAVSTMSSMIHDPFVSENVKKPFIIIDAWDSIIKHIDEKKRSHIEKILLSTIEKNNAFIIFVTESDDILSTESSADGVIELIRERHELFVKRKMSISKLNGMPTIPPILPFTLSGGRFQIFSGLKNEKISHPNHFILIPDSDEKYSTGNKSFDDTLKGGFKKGSIIGFEIDNSVDRFAFVPLFAPLVLNFLSHENSVIIAAPTDQDSNTLTKYVEPYIEKRKFVEKFRIIGNSINSDELDLETEQNDFDSIHKKMLEQYSYFKQENQPTLLQMDCSLLELAYPNNADSIQKSIIMTSRQVRANNDLQILSTRQGYKSTRIIKSVSDLYFRVLNYEGIVMLVTEKPHLFLSNIQANYENGYPSMHLLDSS